MLFIMVIHLFVETKKLERQVDADQESIANLVEQVQEKQQGQIQQLTEQVHDEHSLTLYQMAGTFTIFTCLLTAFHMTSHVREYHQPVV